VIAACDAFSAMTAGRPYGDVADRAQAIAELRRCSGTQFDPAVVLVLCDVLEQNLDLEDDPALPVSAPEPAS
jgi:HD-GYP domain-containing protein (c-di-GMP phosphodiesterase class II)